MEIEWSKAVENLKSSLGTEVVERWIAPLKLVSRSSAKLVLEAPNDFFRDWVASHYTDMLREVAGVGGVEVVCAFSKTQPEPVKANQEPLLGERLEKPAPRPGVSYAASPAQAVFLNPKFTFERFVVGPSNRFAHAASLAVAESPAKAYNPLFIYGGVGLGKTHLMQAIGHAVVQRPSSVRVCYISSEQFTNELITAIQTRSMPRFRDRYRTADALLIDDIHFIAGKESTQEEFFHTFNTLYDSHKQIVMSSDRSPKDIAGLEERLVSRFEWGLVTDIQPPDLETRIAILRKKAEEAQCDVPGEVIEFIAGQIKSNIRELEGALIRVVAYCRFFSKMISIQATEEILRDMVREVASRLTVDLIQRKVSDYFQVSVDELKGVGRHRSVMHPRQVAMYLCRRLTNSSLPEIGRAFGGRNHTTALHAVQKVQREIAQDEHKKRLVEHLMHSITTERS